MEPEDEFWLVVKLGTSPSRRHPTEAEARAEAERLAAANPGSRFYTLKATHCACTTIPPVETVRLLPPPTKASTF